MMKRAMTSVQMGSIHVIRDKVNPLGTACQVFRSHCHCYGPSCWRRPEANVKGIAAGLFKITSLRLYPSEGSGSPNSEQKKERLEEKAASIRAKIDSLSGRETGGTQEADSGNNTSQESHACRRSARQSNLSLRRELNNTLTKVKREVDELFEVVPPDDPIYKDHIVPILDNVVTPTLKLIEQASDQALEMSSGPYDVAAIQRWKDTTDEIQKQFVELGKCRKKLDNDVRKTELNGHKNTSVSREKIYSSIALAIFVFFAVVCIMHQIDGFTKLYRLGRKASIY